MHTPVTAFLSNPHARRYLLARHLSLYLLAGERGKEKKKGFGRAIRHRDPFLSCGHRIDQYSNCIHHSVSAPVSG